MNPVRKSQASSSLIQNIERNKSKPNFFDSFFLEVINNHPIFIQIDYQTKTTKVLKIDI